MENPTSKLSRRARWTSPFDVPNASTSRKDWTAYRRRNDWQKSAKLRYAGGNSCSSSELLDQPLGAGRPRRDAHRAGAHSADAVRARDGRGLQRRALRGAIRIADGVAVWRAVVLDARRLARRPAAGRQGCDQSDRENPSPMRGRVSCEVSTLRAWPRIASTARENLSRILLTCSGPVRQSPREF